MCNNANVLYIIIRRIKMYTTTVWSNVYRKGKGKGNKPKRKKNYSTVDREPDP